MLKYLFLVGGLTCLSLTGCGASGADEPAPLKLKDAASVDVPLEIKTLTSRNIRSRTFSAFKLGEAGARAAEALPALEKLADGPSGPEHPDQKAAAEAIEKIKASQLAADGNS